jgi:hypothetical protein
MSVSGSSQPGLSAGQPADSGSVGRRPGPPPDNTNFAGQDPNALYTQVQAANPEQVGRLATSWNNVGTALETVNQVLSTGATAGANGWTGAAAENALSFHTHVAQWTAVATQASYEAGGNVSSQSDAASNAKYAMPKPVNYGLSQALADFAANPFSVGTIQNKFNQAQANHQQISHVAQQYAVSLNQASQQMPALGPTPTFASAASGNQPSGSVPGGNAGGGPGSGSRLVPGGAAGRIATNPSVGGSGGRIASPGPVSGVPTNPGSGTHLSGAGGVGGSDFSGGGNSGGGVVGGGDPGGGGILPIGPGGGFGGGESGFGGSISGGRSGSAAGRSSGFGPGSGGGDASGARSAAGGGSASGGRSAAGAMSAAEEAASRGTAGQPGTGAMGAGRGRQGAEDPAHQRPSYLVERDPDSIFGVDEMTAPPVIGE